MNKNGKLSLVVKHDCHCTYTNENCDNGNQKATSEYEFCTNEGLGNTPEKELL